MTRLVTKQPAHIRTEYRGCQSITALMGRITVVLLCLSFSALCQISSTRKSLSSVLKLGWTAKDETVKRKYMTVEVGDSTKAEFNPSFTVTAFNGDCRFKVNLSTTRHPLTDAVRTVTQFNNQDKVRLSTDKLAHEIRCKSDHVWEWDVILYERPDTNVFTFPMESHGIDFLKQPPLTVEEIVAGHERPDSLVNAYVLYHASRRDNLIYKDQDDNVVYREIYETGGIGTIYRVKAWDSAGDTVWCDQDIDTKHGTYSKIVPEKFLERAVYPVTIDPTFGNATGGSSAIVGSNAWGHSYSGAQYAAAAGATVDSVHQKMKSYSGAHSIDVAVYTVGSQDRPSTRVGDAVTVNAGSGIEAVYVAACNIALTNGVTYTLCIGDETNSARYYYNSDQGSSDCSRQITNDDLGATWSHGVDANYRLYTYATYTITTQDEPTGRRRILLLNSYGGFFDETDCRTCCSAPSAP